MTGRPKPCQVCGIRPPAMREIPYCFECWPGGPVTPPPCRKCGSTQDYFTSGLCARCHPLAPGEKSQIWLGRRGMTSTVVVDSCLDCDGWGVTRTHGWLCPGCKGWRETYPQIGACRTCTRQQAHLDGNGSCRSCRKQRTWLAKRLGCRIDDLTLQQASAGGQQLFLAVSGMFHAETGPPVYRKKTVPPDMSLLRPVLWEQLVLFGIPRDLRDGLVHGFPAPKWPELEAAFHQFVREHAAAHGWKPGKVEAVQQGIRILLGIQDTPGAAIKHSDVISPA